MIVQDSGTQWLQAYPCKTKDLTGKDKESSTVSLAFFLRVHWNEAKLVKIYCGISVLQPPRRAETNDIAERAIRNVKEGASAIHLQSGLDEKWWAASMACCCHLLNVHDLLSDGVLENHLVGQ